MVLVLRTPYYILELLWSSLCYGQSFHSAFHSAWPLPSFILSFLSFVIGECGISGVGLSMEYWRQPSIPPVKVNAEELSRSSQVLTVTSGNLQAYALDSKEGIENQDPVSNAAVERIASISGPSQYNPQVLPSNYQRNLHHLNARRQRHHNGHGHGQRPREQLPRPYLTCEKYLAYRNRQRFDSGKDGAPVWDSITEEAFQDGNSSPGISFFG
jgi:hypothetical protein